MTSPFQSFLRTSAEQVDPARSQLVYIGIQYSRAVAASLVLIGHALDIMPGSKIPAIYNFGGIGVDIFFVISGFLMWVTTESGRIKPADFWMRRVKRIVPLYWLFTSLIVVVGITIPEALNSTKVTIESAIQSYFFIPHYYSNSIRGNLVAPLLGPGWTLNFEMFFYLVFGICLIPSIFEKRLLSITIFFSVLVAVGTCIPYSAPIWIVYTNQLILEFLFGLYLGRWRSTLEQLPASVGFLLICASLCLAAALFIRSDFPRVLIFGLPAAGFVAGMICLEKALQRKPSSIFLFFGDASYSLYLSHLFAIAPVLFFAKQASISWYFSSPLAIALSFALGALVYTQCEQPIIRLFNTPKRRPELGQASA